MVGPLLLLKMLHCKRISRNLLNSKHSCSEIKIKKEKINYSSITPKDKICRICLKQGTIPIFGDTDLSKAIITFGGIEININDKHPKCICQSCYSLLQNAISFRNSAQEADNVLKQNINNEISSSNQDSIDESDFHNYETITIDTDQDVPEPKRFYCKRCDLYFETLIQLREHKTTEEHETKKHTCPHCNKMYTYLYYQKHLALHKMEPQYVCDICGKEFIAQGHFTKHRETHFYNLPFKCSLCPYRGRFRESLKMHMRSHTGEKPYQCTECSARFVSKSNLNKHAVIHKTEYDFKCDTCGRGFYTKRNLQLHIKVDHAGIKDHPCNICGKVFGYRKQMMKHQLKVHKRAKLRSGRMPIYLQLEAKKCAVDET